MKNKKSILKFIEDSIDTGILYLDDTSNKQELKIVGDIIRKEINIYLNKKLNKTINL